MRGLDDTQEETAAAMSVWKVAIGEQITVSLVSGKVARFWLDYQEEWPNRNGVCYCRSSRSQSRPIANAVQAGQSTRIGNNGRL